MALATRAPRGPNAAPRAPHPPRARDARPPGAQASGKARGARRFRTHSWCAPEIVKVEPVVGSDARVVLEPLREVPDDVGERPLAIFARQLHALHERLAVEVVAIATSVQAER